MTIGLRKFRHVVATARFESVTRAADALHITQSALTRSIADVEAELGVQLFIRLPRGVRVTDAGRSFVERVRQIIGDVDDLLTGVADYRELNSGRLCLGIAPVGYQRFVARPIGRLAAESPNLAIEITTGSADNLAPRLTSGELDAIIGHAGWLRRWPDLDIIPLAEFHCAVIVRTDHPLSRIERISETDVLGYPVVLPSTVEPFQTDIATLYARNGLPPLNPRYICDDLALIEAIINNTDAFMPLISLNPTFGRLRNDFLLLEHALEMPIQRIAMAASRTRPRSPAANAIERHLKDALIHDRE